jgi:hypothetical protein
MKGVGLLIVKILLIIAAILSILYFLDIPVTEVAGEKIGFADLINFFLVQLPPSLPERDMKNSTGISEWASKIDGSDLGGSAGMLAKLGSPIKFYIFSDYNYCQNFRIEGGKIYETSEAPQKTVYLSYQLAMELKTRAETQNFQGMEKRLVQAIKNGEIKGLSITDVMGLGG